MVGGFLDRGSIGLYEFLFAIVLGLILAVLYCLGQFSGFLLVITYVLPLCWSFWLLVLFSGYGFCAVFLYCFLPPLFYGTIPLLY